MLDHRPDVAEGCTFPSLPPVKLTAVSKIVVASTPASGQVAGLLLVAGDLRRRGHHVTVLTGAEFRGWVLRAGVDFSPMPAGIVGGRAMTPAQFDAFCTAIVALRPESVIGDHLLLATLARPADPLPSSAPLTVALGTSPPLDRLVRVPHHYLQLTVPSFACPPVDAPPSFRFIGPLPEHASLVRTVPAWWPTLWSGRTVVVVAQESAVGADLLRLVVPALHALAGIDVLVVAATGHVGSAARLIDLEPDIPPNAVLAEDVPFDLLLPYASALVTSGGYNSVHTAIRSGTPMIVSADTDSGPQVAERVADCGIGVDLGDAFPSSDAIRDAVQTVVRSTRYRQRAAELRAELTRFDALSAIAATVAPQ
ncbi:glycosyltransferase [Dactylosporangium sp. CA-233914]|uniref:glycosyltransferase n=1 Tax=Dactylosporangium sp. CA-233914 TaxID=3239934 RepID=UPI003D9483AA